MSAPDRKLTMEWAKGLVSSLGQEPSQAASPIFDRILEASAIRASYGVGEIESSVTEYDPDSDWRALNAVLQESERRLSVGSAVRWGLSDQVRRQVLARLIEQGKIEAVTQGLEQDADDVTRMLVAYLRGTAPALEAQTPAQLAATHEVSNWLRGLVEDVPEPDEVLSLIERNDLLRPLRLLVGSHFRGREEEQRKLREYVGVLPPTSVIDRLGRLVHDILDLSKSPPLFIHGPGGVGKSALLAKFVLDHAEAARSHRFPFAYLNFDRPSLRVEEPLTLLLEAVHQVGVLMPEHGQRARELHSQWRQRMRGLSSSIEADSAFESPVMQTNVHSDDYDAFEAEFCEFAAHAAGHDGDKPFLLILDTFEEVQSRGRDYENQTWTLLSSLQGKCPHLRIVMAGRAPATRFPITAIKLDAFDTPSAVGFVQYLLKDKNRSKLASPGLAEEIVKRVGGSPLSLRLAIDVFEEMGREGIEDLAGGWRFWRRLNETQIQGVLYRRILGRIKDREIRRLAHPGLTLRFITPDIIRHVLAKPCKLDVRTDGDAQRLFEKLESEAALVHRDGEGLRHRSDVRKAMLAGLRADKPEKVDRIHRAAWKYYSKRDDLASLGEEIYHRLALNQSEKAIDQRWRPGVEAYLADTLDEFEPRARAYLASRLDVELDREAIEEAELMTWERHAARRSRTLLEQGKALAAIELLGQRAGRSVGSPLFELEAQVLEKAGHVDGALEATRRGLEDAVKRGALQEVLAHLRRRARLQMDEGQPQRARDSLQRASEVAAELGDDLQQIRVALAQTDVWEVLGKQGRVTETLGAIRGWLEGVPAGRLSQDHGLLRRLAVRVGVDNTHVVQLALQTLGFGKRPSAEELARRLVAWGEEVSSSEKERKAVALHEGVALKSSDQNGWRDWFVENKEQYVVKVLTELLKRHGDSGTAASDVGAYLSSLYADDGRASDARE